VVYREAMSTKTVHLRICKLDDPDEAARLEEALKAAAGVETVQVDANTNEAIVEHTDVAPKKLTEALRAKGYISEEKK